MRLFIAEKPSMGMEIAKVLANKNNKSLERSDGFITCVRYCKSGVCGVR